MITPIREVPPLANSPGVFEAIAYRERQLLLSLFVGQLIEFEMPEEVFLETASCAVRERARFGPAFAKVAEHRVLRVDQRDGELPWTRCRHALMERGAEGQHRPRVGDG